MRDRGPAGVQLVISDAHRGLTAGVGTVLQGSAWQRCRVHFMRNVLARVRKGDTGTVGAAIRTIFAQPTAEAVRCQLHSVAGKLIATFPAVAGMLTDAFPAVAGITAFADFPQPHWKKIWSTNPLERLNKEVKRRTDVAGIFPSATALHRLAGAVLIEAHDEWQATDRRYLAETSMTTLTAKPILIPTPNATTSQPELAAA